MVKVKELGLSAGVLAVVVVLAMVPSMVCTIVGLNAIASMGMLGAITGLAATVTAGWKTGARVSVAVGLAAAAVVPFTDRPLGAAFVFFGIGLLMGLVGAVDSWSAYTMVAVPAAFVLALDPTVSTNLGVEALALFAVLALSSLFAVGVVTVIVKGKHGRLPKPLHPVHAVGFGVVLGLSFAVVAYFVAADQVGHAGAWVIMTMALVMRPYMQDSWSHTLQRAAGTVGGFVIAMAVATFAPNTTMLYALGIVAAYVMVLFKVQGRPYWMFAVPLTVTIVFLEGAHTSVTGTAWERLVATLVGAGVALLVMVVVRPLGNGYLARHPKLHEEIHKYEVG